MKVVLYDRYAKTKTLMKIYIPSYLWKYTVNILKRTTTDRLEMTRTRNISFQFKRVGEYIKYPTLNAFRYNF